MVCALAKAPQSVLEPIDMDIAVQIVMLDASPYLSMVRRIAAARCPR